MIIPGSDVLDLAASLIATERPRLSRVILPLPAPDGAGVITPTYYKGVTIIASVQPVPRGSYQANGLDFQKNYIYCYTSEYLRDIQRDGACDMLDYKGRRYNVLSKEPWDGQDGWSAALCEDIGAAP